MKEHPPTMYSMLADSEEVLTNDDVNRPQSPAWALQVSAEKNHSGECPLFVHKLLNPSMVSTSLTFSRYRKLNRLFLLAHTFLVSCTYHITRALPHACFPSFPTLLFANSQHVE